jgi:protein-export membrane protein, secD/secF family
MNRYPTWKYVLVIVVLCLSVLCAIPNLFKEIPAIQISAARQPAQITQALQEQMLSLLKTHAIPTTGAFIENESLKIRFPSTAAQAAARPLLENNLGQGYVVALNFISGTPHWLEKIGAKPMYLGLDLRGGLHFLLQVDMSTAYRKKMDTYTTDLRSLLHNHHIRNGGAKIHDSDIKIAFQNNEKATEALRLIKKEIPTLNNIALGGDDTLIIHVDPRAGMQQTEAGVIQQNIQTLNNRINALGVAEPIIQQAGSDRIMIQLPGIQDSAQAKNIIGRTATLEVHLVANDRLQQEAYTSNTVPDGYEKIDNPQTGIPLLVNKNIELTGDNINHASPGQTELGQAAVDLKLDRTGAERFYELTKANRGKQIAMVLVEEDHKEVVTAPRVNEPIPGGNVQISGSMNQKEASDIALLLQSGSLAAPMKIIEERSIGPSAGKENIAKGFHSVLWGFATIIIFMVLYYRMFGVFSSLSLFTNLIMLIALLSLIQATLTLPGIAAVALTLGMAIDANVLINERIREELRRGDPPRLACSKGYEFAWGTILDSNVTSLIAGLALLIFSGAGPVKGFAVVHCLGILTSMFSSVVVSRAIVNAWYGRKRNLKHLSIGMNYNQKKV